MTNRDTMCTAAARWLDEGAPPRHADATRLRTHAAQCARCADALQAAAAVDAMLGQPSDMPAGFADAVMARIAVESLTASTPAHESPTREAWWREVGRSPEVAGGFAAGLVTAGVLPLLASALAGGEVRRALAQQWEGVRRVVDVHPAALGGVLCVGVLLAVPLARACYRWAGNPRSGPR